VLFALRPSSELRERGSRRARILALIHDPRRRIRLNPALVAQLHGLTSTEAALATAIAEGHTLAEFAIVRGCTELTARTHLKRILDKTGTNRQPELVRVLLTSVAMHSFQ
jgi:DNA-binding CsgD family transcriptional regulator